MVIAHSKPGISRCDSSLSGIIILMLYCLSWAVAQARNFSVHITQLCGRKMALFSFETLNMCQTLIWNCASIVSNIPHNMRVFHGDRWIQIQYYPLQVHYRKPQHATLLYLGKIRILFLLNTSFCAGNHEIYLVYFHWKAHVRDF